MSEIEIMCWDGKRVWMVLWVFILIDTGGRYLVPYSTFCLHQWNEGRSIPTELVNVTSLTRGCTLISISYFDMFWTPYHMWYPWVIFWRPPYPYPITMDKFSKHKWTLIITNIGQGREVYISKSLQHFMNIFRGNCKIYRI